MQIHTGKITAKGKEYLNKMNMDNPEKLATLLQAFFVEK